MQSSTISLFFCDASLRLAFSSIPQPMEPSLQSLSSTPSTSSPEISSHLSVEEHSVDELFEFFVTRGATASSSEPELRRFQDVCNNLFARDYNLSLLPNANGEFCPTYPLDLVVLESEKSTPHKMEERVGEAHKLNDAPTLEALFKACRYSRVHQRFVIPVILVRNRNITRSGTISVLGETIYNQLCGKSRQLFRYVYSTKGKTSSEQDAFILNMELHRNADVSLLSCLKVKYICDLMVENQKKKMGLSLTSSEKVESQLYSRFKINVIPYPGCEFFKVFRDNNYDGRKIVFDWNQWFVNAELSIASETTTLSRAWNEYKSWDIVSLTKNYMHLLMQLLSDPESDSGLLVHCVSGWDRTPLFISLLRLSLWADGEVHRSLNATEMLYLTLAYDWMLFKHQLSDRLAKGEEVFYFCFYFLQFIHGLEFSLPPCHTGACSQGRRECSEPVAAPSSDTHVPNGLQSPNSFGPQESDGLESAVKGDAVEEEVYEQHIQNNSIDVLSRRANLIDEVHHPQLAQEAHHAFSAHKPLSPPVSALSAAFAARQAASPATSPHSTASSPIPFSSTAFRTAAHHQLAASTDFEFSSQFSVRPASVDSRTNDEISASRSKPIAIPSKSLPKRPSRQSMTGDLSPSDIDRVGSWQFIQSGGSPEAFSAHSHHSFSQRVHPSSHAYSHDQMRDAITEEKSPHLSNSPPAPTILGTRALTAPHFEGSISSHETDRQRSRSDLFSVSVHTNSLVAPPQEYVYHGTSPASPSLSASCPDQPQPSQESLHSPPEVKTNGSTNGPTNGHSAPSTTSCSCMMSDEERAQRRASRLKAIEAQFMLLYKKHVSLRLVNPSSPPLPTNLSPTASTVSSASTASVSAGQPPSPSLEASRMEQNEARTSFNLLSWIPGIGYN